MKRRKKPTELVQQNTNSVQPEKFYCERPWSDVWQATLAMQWLGRPSSLLRQDYCAMQWLEFWSRLSDSRALTLLNHFEQAGYLKRKEQVGRHPQFQVEPSYHEEIDLCIVSTRCLGQVKQEIYLPELNQPHFSTHCHRAWTSMRILCTFNLSQIVVCSEIEQLIAEKYIYQLYQIGYLQLIESYGKNIISSEDVFRLWTNSGPLAPLVCTDGIVYDLNSRELYMTEHI